MSKIVKFAEFEVDASLVNKQNAKKWTGVWPKSWARVEIELPDNYNAPKAVEDWLDANIKGAYSCHHFSTPTKSGSHHYIYNNTIMVIAFEEANEAMLFKLKGGHRAFENTEATFS